MKDARLKTWRPHMVRIRLFQLLTWAICLGAVYSLSFAARTNAQKGPTPGPIGTVAESFTLAARHWGVPVEVLMAVGYVESRWEQRDGQPSIDKGYGIMHLVDSPDGAGTLHAEPS